MAAAFFYAPPADPSSSSRSSSSRRNSKKWIFLKDLLNRSKSEGRARSKERFWSAISFSTVAKEKEAPVLSLSSSRDEKGGTEVKNKERKAPASRKPANGVWRRRTAPLFFPSASSPFFSVYAPPPHSSAQI